MCLNLNTKTKEVITNNQTNKQKNNVLGCSYVYVDDTNTEQQFTMKEDQEITFTYTDEIVM